MFNLNKALTTLSDKLTEVEIQIDELQSTTQDQLSELEERTDRLIDRLPKEVRERALAQIQNSKQSPSK
jgi:hypothetical protein